MGKRYKISYDVMLKYTGMKLFLNQQSLNDFQFSKNI